MLLLYNSRLRARRHAGRSTRPRSVIWVLVSWYLCADRDLLRRHARHQHGGASVAADARRHRGGGGDRRVIAILAYFRLLGPISDLFLRYGRARGTFNDPNVLGAFLILPALLALAARSARRSRHSRAASLLLCLIASRSCSPSRAPPGASLPCTAALLMLLTFVTSRSQHERMRIVPDRDRGRGGDGAVPRGAAVDRQGRATCSRSAPSLEQAYDVGHLGRFGRYILGVELALDRAVRHRAAAVPQDLPRRPAQHLSQRLHVGRLALRLRLSHASWRPRLVLGLRFVFVATPWQATYLAVYCAFVGVAVESVIIDSDHWRHYFLLLGVMWGLMIGVASLSASRRSKLVPYWYGATGTLIAAWLARPIRIRHRSSSHAVRRLTSPPRTITRAASRFSTCSGCSPCWRWCCSTMPSAAPRPTATPACLAARHRSRSPSTAISASSSSSSSAASSSPIRPRAAPPRASRSRAFARIYPGFVICMTVTFLVTLAIGGAALRRPPCTQWFANLFIVSPAVKQPFMDGAYWSIVYEITFYGWVFLLASLTNVPPRHRLDRRRLARDLDRQRMILVHSGAVAAPVSDRPERVLFAGLLLYEIYRGGATARIISCWRSRPPSRSIRPSSAPTGCASTIHIRVRQRR